MGLIYERINQYLEENGIKQSFVCEKAKIEKNAFSKAMKGERRISADEYADICKALNVSLDFFAAKSTVA